MLSILTGYRAWALNLFIYLLTNLFIYTARAPLTLFKCVQQYFTVDRVFPPELYTHKTLFSSLILVDITYMDNKRLEG